MGGSWVGGDGDEETQAGRVSGSFPPSLMFMPCRGSDLLSPPQRYLSRNSGFPVLAPTPAGQSRVVPCLPSCSKAGFLVPCGGESERHTLLMLPRPQGSPGWEGTRRGSAVCPSLTEHGVLQPRPHVGDSIHSWFNTCSLSPLAHGEMKHREVWQPAPGHTAGHGRTGTQKRRSLGSSRGPGHFI